MSATPFCVGGYLPARPKLSLVLAWPCSDVGPPEPHREIMVISEAHWGREDVETARELPGLPGG